MTNRGRESIDVTLLFIDSRFGVDPGFPRPGTSADNRVRPGGSLLVEATVNAEKTIGTEHMVVIAVRADGLPVDLACLVEPSLEDAKRSTALRGNGQAAGLRSPLGDLLTGAMYAGTTRGLDLNVVNRHDLRLVSWTVKPLPANGK